MKPKTTAKIQRIQSLLEQAAEAALELLDQANRDGDHGLYADLTAISAMTGAACNLVDVLLEADAPPPEGKPVYPVMLTSRDITLNHALSR